MTTDNAAPASADTAAEQAVPLKQLQSVQRKLDTSRRQLQEVSAKYAADSVQSAARLERVETVLERLVDAFAKSDVMEAQRPLLEETKTAVAAHRVKSAEDATAYSDFTKFAIEHEVDMQNDPRFEGFRKAYGERKYEEARRQAEEAIKTVSTLNEERDAVLAELKNEVAALKKATGKVDTGTSTATAPKPPDIAELLGKSTSSMSSKELAEHKSAIMKAAGLREK